MDSDNVFKVTQSVHASQMTKRDVYLPKCIKPNVLATHSTKADDRKPNKH